MKVTVMRIWGWRWCLGAMTDEGLDSACASASVQPVSVQCTQCKCAASQETQLHPLLHISYARYNGVLEYRYNVHVYNVQCTCVHVHLECNVQCTRVQGTLYLSTSRSQQHRNQSGNRGAPSCNPLNNLHFLLCSCFTFPPHWGWFVLYISTWGWLDPHLSIRHFLSPVSVIWTGGDMLLTTPSAKWVTTFTFCPMSVGFVGLVVVV